MNEGIARIRRSVVVGIGGSGIQVVQFIKRALIQFYEKIPYSIKFLAMDTDSNRPSPLRVNIKGERTTVVGIREDEFHYLNVENPLNVIQTSPAIKQWWPKGIPVNAILHGAGGYRARGRLAFHAYAHKVEGIITQVVSQVMAGNLAHNMYQEQGFKLIDNSVDVYIIASLAGGTGSGSFIDAAFLFHKALENVEHRVIGFLILPSVFEGLPITPRVQMNGYAALKELDYYMDINSLRQAPTFVFGSSEFSPRRPPYDLISLVDAVQENGNIIPGKGTSSGVLTLCRIVGEGIALNLGNIGQRSESAFDNLAGIVANSPRWNKKNSCYSTLGISSIIYPIEKHFNQISTYYAYTLIDGLNGLIKGDNGNGQDKEVEEAIQKFLTEARLNKEQILDDILTYQNLLFRLSADGLGSSSELNLEVDSGVRRRDSLREVTGQNRIQKEENALEVVKSFLKDREESKGFIYTRKSAEKIAARLGLFKDEFLEEIKSLEKKLGKNQEMAKDFYDNNVTKVGLGFRILRKQGKIFQSYLDEMGEVFKLELDIERHRQAIEVLNKIIQSMKNYIEGLGLGVMEMKLSRVREKIEQDYFGTTRVLDEYGHFSLILFPHDIFIKTTGQDGRIKLSQTKELIELPSDFSKLNIKPPDPKEFLKENKMTMGDIEDINWKDLWKKIMSYTHKMVGPIKNIDIETLLSLRKEGLEYWLREASRRAVPFWRHNASVDQAATMEEIFIIGVNSEHKTTLNNILFPDAQYPPTIMSTSDPHKIFFFKYKAPLAVYLLADMERYRLMYLEAPIENTPHIAEDLEFKMPDLFPEDTSYKQAFRIYMLSMALGLIKEEKFYGRYVIDDSRCLKADEEGLELGYPAWRVFEELKKPHRQELVDALLSILKEKIETSPERVSKVMRAYLEDVKKTFNEEDRSINLGDKILLHKQLTFLDSWVKNGSSANELIA